MERCNCYSYFINGRYKKDLGNSHRNYRIDIYSVIAMAISQVFFIAAIDKVGIAITSLHLNFSPFYVMIILFVLGGTWDLRAVIGASIVAFGVWLAQVK